MVGNIDPTLKKAAKDRVLFKAVRAGEFICDRHPREFRKGKRNGFDGVVMFVFQ